MTDELMTRELEDALELRHEAGEAGQEDPHAGRRVRLRLVPWDTVATAPADPGQPGGRPYQEAFVRGAFDGIDPRRVTIEAGGHGQPLVGRGETLEQLEDAAYLDAIIARTAAGDELLELARAGVYTDVSVGFLPVTGGSRRRRDGTIERTRADLRRVAILERGSYPGAQLVHIREESSMPATDPIPAAPSLEEMATMVRGIVQDAIPAPVVSVPAPDQPSAILGRASSFADLYQRVMDGDEELVRALADQLTTDVPEIVRPAWLTNVLGILPAARPAVSAFGRDPLPDGGMEVNWPTFDGANDNSALRVAEQLTEKSEIVSAKILLGSDKTTIRTFAGGLDVSWQLLRRSSPSFREIALRILTTAWASVTDKAFVTDLVAKGTAGPVIAAGADAAAIHAALVEASAMVDDATGAPAGFVLAGSQAWLAAATAVGLGVSPYSVQNVPGTVAASTLNVSISGLTITRDRNLGPTDVIVSNGLAASWLEDGPFTAEQDVVAKLGTDTAIWSLGATGVFIPSGVIKMTAAPIARASSAKGDK